MLADKIKKTKVTSRPGKEKKSSGGLKRINVGPRYCDAVVHGNVVYLAGEVAIKTRGKSVTLQTKEILSIIDDTLKQAGTNKSKIIRANIWLADIKTAAEMNTVWDKWVSKGNAPARATVEAKLVDPKCAVEIMVTAAL